MKILLYFFPIFFTSCNSVTFRSIELSAFPVRDTLASLTTTDSFNFKYKDKFEIEIISKLKDCYKKRTSINIIIKNKSQTDIWVGDTWRVICSEKKLQVFSTPDVNLVEPMIFLQIKPGKQCTFKLKNEGRFNTFDLGLYFINDYHAMVDSALLTSSVTVSKHRRHNYITIPHNGIPNKGLSFLSIENFSLDGSERELVLKISNQ